MSYQVNCIPYVWRANECKHIAYYWKMSETYFFTLEEGKEDVTFINFIQKFDIVILIVVSLSTLVILKKK